MIRIRSVYKGWKAKKLGRQSSLVTGWSFNPQNILTPRCICFFEGAMESGKS